MLSQLSYAPLNLFAVTFASSATVNIILYRGANVNTKFKIFLFFRFDDFLELFLGKTLVFVAEMTVRHCVAFFVGKASNLVVR